MSIGRLRLQLFFFPAVGAAGESCDHEFVLSALRPPQAFNSPDGTSNMLSYLWNRFSSIQKALSHFLYHILSFFSHSAPSFIKNDSFNHKKSRDLESNIPSDIPSDTSICETYTVRLQPQHDLSIVGVGASGQVYDVDDQVVLKTCRIFEPPGSDASQSDCWHYASDTLFHFNLLKDERTVLRLLQNRPHPHIIESHRY